jgi:hypothetical protein
MSAAGQKDPTLKSGKAQLVAMDVEDSRYTDFVQSYEEFCLDEAELLEDVARETGATQTMYVGKKEVEIVDLAKIDLDRDKYVRKCFPTSALATAPAQRMEQVQNLANAGWITPADAKRMLDFPDLEQASELDTAPYDIVMESLDNMLESGEYRAPIPQMDLKMAVGLSVNYYLRARVRFKAAPPENLDLILRFMSEASALLNPPQEQPPQPEAAPTGASPSIGQGPPGGAMPPQPPAPAPGMAA